MSKDTDTSSSCSENPNNGATTTMPSNNNALKKHTMPHVLAIGASAGGVTALRSLLPNIPQKSDIAYVVVIHLSPDHESHLAEILQLETNIPVVQVPDEIQLQPDHIYIIPPNRNLESINDMLRLSPLESQRYKRAPIDHFFRTLAKTHKGYAAGVVLSGTGSDGTLGLQDIKDMGGLTVAQDPLEAEYDDMPQSAISAGVVDLVLPLADIITRAQSFLQTDPAIPPENDSANNTPNRIQPELMTLVKLIRARSGRDFSLYKYSTIFRRIRRRMQLAHMEELNDYLELIRTNDNELNALADDFLITVTSFFRDPNVFEELSQKIVPEILKNKNSNHSVRVWSAGCATGEEAYSIAMLLIEQTQTLDDPPEIQIFATDLREDALSKAREGIFTSDIEGDISSARLKRFFKKENGAYRVKPELRDTVVFASHNLLSDPPFSNLDLVLCRNLLIYLQRKIQPNIIDLFHYSLRNSGILVLGSAESMESSDLFQTDDKALCLHRKRGVPVPELVLPVFPPLSKQHDSTNANRENMEHGPAETRSYGEMHHRLVERYAPPSILVNSENKVVHFSEHAGRYMRQPGGTPTSNVFKLVREELQIELRAALHAALHRNEAVRSQHATITIDGKPRQVSIQTWPNLERVEDGLVLVIFDEHTSATTNHHMMEPASKELAIELELTKQRLKTSIEEYEASQEGMRASNEELQSANEELRSTMEELETSKEELQSINEELQTANLENRQKVIELSDLSSDLQHLMAATHIATLFLDRQLRILRFTPQVAELFSLRDVDKGRPLADITHRLGYNDLFKDTETVLEQLTPIEREVIDQSGEWYLVCTRIYRSTEDRIEGVVITFINTTRHKKAKEDLLESESRYRNLFRSIDEGFCVLQEELKKDDALVLQVTEVNPSFEKQTGLKLNESLTIQSSVPAEGKLFFDIRDHLAKEDNVTAHFEYYMQQEQRWLEVHAFKLREGKKDHIAILCKDITEQQKNKDALRESAERDSFRLALADTLRSSSQPKEIQDTGCDLLRKHLNTTEVLTYELNASNESGSGLNHPDFCPWKSPHELKKSFLSNQSCIIEDTRLYDADTATFFSHFSTAIIHDEKILFILSVNDSRPRKWTSNEAAVIVEACERIWAASEQAKTEQAVRQSETALQEASKHKDAFLAALSHELRNPLAPIMNSLGIMELPNRSASEVAGALSTMKRQVNLLSRLVDDLLDITRIARGKIELKSELIDLNKVTQGVIDDYGYMCKEKGITLTSSLPDTPTPVIGDRSRIKQCIGNILQNCTKFTGSGGTVHISLNLTGACAIVEVRDTGIGIPPKLLRHLFEPFMQGDNSLARSSGGLGMGLALCKGLMELHGGMISASSKGEGLGSEFRMEFSVYDGPLDKLKTFTSPAYQDISQPRRVLVVEDNKDAADSLLVLLNLIGHNAVVAYEAQSGLKQAREFNPDIVLCDIGLPNMNGYEFARAWQMDDSLPKSTLVALSGYASPTDKQRAIDAGFSHHLSKPTTIAKLHELFALESADKTIVEEE